MNLRNPRAELQFASSLETWGGQDAFDLYLDRCQVDTPANIVSLLWSQIKAKRRAITKVVDFGAGDGRFAWGGRYRRYIGFEIDEARCRSARLPRRAELRSRCAFSERISDADVCLGNPPYVRNQDLPSGWRQHASAELKARTGVELSGLANAWQYFFLQALASTTPTGLVALVVPYEWVSRPSAKALREFIRSRRWEVAAYRLLDETFDRVLTTSSITIVDKSAHSDRWSYFAQQSDGRFEPLRSPSGGKAGVVPYEQRRPQETRIVAKRGLSPGTQEVLTLTEGERVRFGLRRGVDVVPCITSLRCLEAACTNITESVFDRCYRRAGHKCWLIRTDRKPSARLAAYLAHVPRSKYQTATCLGRPTWWRFRMPEAPSLFVSSGFIGRFPKAAVNSIGAIAVGAVYGVEGVPKRRTRTIIDQLQSLNLSTRIVAHAHGLRKLEINQLNALLTSMLG